MRALFDRKYLTSQGRAVVFYPDGRGMRRSDEDGLYTLRSLTLPERETVDTLRLSWLRSRIGGAVVTASLLCVFSWLSRRAQTSAVPAVVFAGYVSVHLALFFCGAIWRRAVGRAMAGRQLTFTRLTQAEYLSFRLGDAARR